MTDHLFQKDFISTQDWRVDDLRTAIDVALRLKSERHAGQVHDQILRAKTRYMLFFEESTRTRNSFETGMTQMGGHAIYYTASDGKIGVRESVEDVGRVFDRYLDILALRVFSHDHLVTCSRSWARVKPATGASGEI